MRNEIVAKSQSLRNTSDPIMKLIYINPDKPRDILEKEYQLRSELRRRQSNGGKDVIIKKGKIITKLITHEDSSETGATTSQGQPRTQ